jgi:hypothetical protein
VAEVQEQVFGPKRLAVQFVAEENKAEGADREVQEEAVQQAEAGQVAAPRYR